MRHLLTTCCLLGAGLLADVPAVAADATGGGEIDVVSTVTPLERQQLDQERPSYHQPTPLAGQPPATTLPLSLGTGETLVFLGNGLAERMEHANVFETLLRGRELHERTDRLREAHAVAELPARRHRSATAGARRADRLRSPS